MNTPSVSAKVIADKPCPIRGGRVADDWNFLEDRRKTKPGLHLLYTASAIKHLLAISECIAKLSSFSNLNMLDPIQALIDSRTKLIQDNAAFAEAAIIIDSIAPYLQEGLHFELPNPESYIEGE